MQCLIHSVWKEEVCAEKNANRGPRAGTITFRVRVQGQVPLLPSTPHCPPSWECCVCVCVREHKYVYIYIYTYIHTYILHTYIYIYMYIYMGTMAIVYIICIIHNINSTQMYWSI